MFRALSRGIRDVPIDQYIQYVLDGETKLDISDEPRTEEEVARFASAVSNNEQVVSLDVGKIRLTDEGCGKLIASIRSNPNLVSLSLYENEITDKSVVAIAQILRHMHNLKTLNFYFNEKITDVGVAALAEALPYSHLQKLDLRNTDISDEGAALLAKAIPDSVLREVPLSTYRIFASSLMPKITRVGQDCVKDASRQPINRRTFFAFYAGAMQRAHGVRPSSPPAAAFVSRDGDTAVCRRVISWLG